MRFAKSGRISLIAVTEESNAGLSDANTGTVGEFLESLRLPTQWWMTKWRGDTVLISPWRVQPEARTPFQTIEDLRTARSQHQGLMPLETLLKMDSVLIDVQKKELRQEFPALGSLIAMRGFLQLYRQYPEMKRPGGIALNKEIKDFLKGQTASELARLLPAAVRLRSTESVQRLGQEQMRMIEFELLDEKKQRLTGTGFAFR